MTAIGHGVYSDGTHWFDVGSVDDSVYCQVVKAEDCLVCEVARLKALIEEMERRATADDHGIVTITKELLDSVLGR